MSMEDYDYLFKIVLIGNAGVGKTCLVRRFTQGLFPPGQGATIGVDFMIKTVEIKGEKVKLQIWDTAGQERFRSITQSYYRSANALILTYDITCEDSFRCLPEWLKEIEQYANNQVVTILVGKRVKVLCASMTNGPLVSSSLQNCEQYCLLYLTGTASMIRDHLQENITELTSEAVSKIWFDFSYCYYIFFLLCDFIQSSHKHRLCLRPSHSHMHAPAPPLPSASSTPATVLNGDLCCHARGHILSYVDRCACMPYR
ncbi:hypothetical protein Q8A73_007050 [Channa argus]|nr:hypothetical protein Q8A73_007050 [Channa argus]